MKKLIYILLLIPSFFFGQDDLLAELDTVQVDSYKSAAFKGLKIVNFESTKMGWQQGTVLCGCAQVWLGQNRI